MWPFRRRQATPDATNTADAPDTVEPSDRLIHLRGPLDDAEASGVISQLLFHTYESPQRPITLDVDSIGGSLSATVAIVDTIKTLSAPVHTRCSGVAHGGAAIIVACGRRGFRTVGPNSEFALVPVRSDDPKVSQRDLQQDSRLLVELLADATNRSLEQVQVDLVGGRRFDAAGAIEYGLADRIAVDPTHVPTRQPALHFSDNNAETEWLTATDPTAMLEFLSEIVAGRKMRLFAIACCAGFVQWLIDQRSRRCLEVADRLADGLVGDEELAAAREEASSNDLLIDLPSHLAGAARAAYFAVLDEEYLSVADVMQAAVQDSAASLPDQEWAERIIAAECLRQANLLRDIFGNPIRPSVVDPRWRTSDVIGVAQAIYEDRAFDRLPILGDALMDAGCDDDAMLEHCRSEGPHVKGCWVVDLVLGKS